MRPSRAAALAIFAFRTNVRSPITLGGLLAFGAISMLGPLLSLRSGQGWALDPDLLFYGYLTGGLFVLRSGLEQQRECGLQMYLRHNFATPLEHGLGAVLALLATWALLTGVLVVVALAGSGGDAASALWYAWALGVPLTLLLPFALMVEGVSTLRIPMIVPVLAYLVLAVFLALTVGEARMAAVLGLSPERGNPASSLDLAVRAGVMVPLGMSLFLAGVWATHLRAGPIRAAGVRGR